MLINLSNHPSSKWQPPQLEAAKVFGEIVDWTFPKIDPYAETEKIHLLAEEHFKKINALGKKEVLAIHLAGELTFTFHLVALLKSAGIPVYASTTERNIKINENGEEIPVFSFIRFRSYY
jgi:hypothetical protein